MKFQLNQWGKGQEKPKTGGGGETPSRPNESLALIGPKNPKGFSGGLEQIEKLRNRIDIIDRKIVKLLEKRVDIARRIGKIKKKNRLKISDSEREQEVIKNVLIRFSKGNIDKNFVKKLFRLIIKYCKDEEEK